MQHQISFNVYSISLTSKENYYIYEHTNGVQKKINILIKSVYQSPLISTTLLHSDLINVAYHTACAFIRSSERCTFWMTSLPRTCMYVQTSAASLAIQQAPSKPCLVNLISKTLTQYSLYPRPGTSPFPSKTDYHNLFVIGIKFICT